MPLDVAAGGAAEHLVDFGKGRQQVGYAHALIVAANKKGRIFAGGQDLGVDTAVVQEQLVVLEPLADAIGAFRVCWRG